MTKVKKTDNEKEIIPVNDSDGIPGIPESDGCDDKIDESIERLKQAEAKAAEYLDQLQRLQAEFSNYRKRTDKEKLSLRDWLHGEMVREMLPVMDDLERLLHSHENQNTIDIGGVQLIQQKFQKILKDRGLEEIESVGQVFNPDFHEAVDVEHTDEDKAGKVLAEWEKGYKIGEKLLRPSRVKVGKFDGKAGDDSK